MSIHPDAKTKKPFVFAPMADRLSMLANSDSETSITSAAVRPRTTTRRRGSPDNGSVIVNIPESDGSRRRSDKTNFLLITTIIMSILAGGLGLFLVLMKAAEKRKKEQEPELPTTQPQPTTQQPQKQPTLRPQIRSPTPIQDAPRAFEPVAPTLGVIKTGKTLNTKSVPYGLRRKFHDMNARFVNEVDPQSLSNVSAVMFYDEPHERDNVHKICAAMNMRVMYVDVNQCGLPDEAQYVPALSYCYENGTDRIDYGDEIITTLQGFYTQYSKSVNQPAVTQPTTIQHVVQKQPTADRQLEGVIDSPERWAKYREASGPVEISIGQSATNTPAVNIDSQPLTSSARAKIDEVSRMMQSKNNGSSIQEINDF